MLAYYNMPSSTVTNTSFHNNDDNQSHNVQHKFKQMYFPSNARKNIIVNAITGKPYTWFSGTVDELRLFRVVDSSGRCDNKGFYDRRGNHRGTFNKEPNVLYYDGPNEYMQHRKTTVPAALVSEWNTTRAELFSGEGGTLNVEAFNRLKMSGKIRANLTV